MNLIQATKIANRIVDILQPSCDKIYIAGSVRRMKEEVKDIEIVALPKSIHLQQGLFGEKELKTPVAAFIQALSVFTKEVLKGKPTGRYMQIALLNTDIKLDLFLPQEKDFYRQLAIRTGSATYSHHIIAAAWLKKGWVGTDDGLRLIDECNGKKSGDKTTWTCISENPTLPPVWKTEEEFFNWLEIEYKEPSKRNF